jgi:pyruvate kinase
MTSVATRDSPSSLLTSRTARRTAIVATVGATSGNPAGVEGLFRAGVDVFRLSMVSGNHERHANVVRWIRALSAEHGRDVLVMADLQGRKNRLGSLPGDRALWRNGEVVVLTAGRDHTDSHRTWTRYPWRTDVTRPGTRIFVDDGLVELEVTDADASALRCVVLDGGPVSTGRGLTIQGATTIAPGLAERDRDDLAVALRLGADVVALSFANTAADAAELRALAPGVMTVAKVEHPDALAALPEVIDAFDAVMVARGDLALEVPFQDVPFEQKRIVAACAERATLSIVATQLLFSMREHSRPTRAEVADIANAVLDGADALMLSGETGFGRYPVQAVEVLKRVIQRAEDHLRGPLTTASDPSVVVSHTTNS